MTRPFEQIPGPTPWRPMGSAYELRRRLLSTLLSGLHIYGDIVGYPVGPPGRFRGTLVVAHHPDDVQHILTQTEKTTTKDTLGFKAMAEMFGKGLLTSTGETWKRQRRITQPLFTPRRVSGYATLMAEEAARTVSTLPDRPVDLHDLMLKYTLRVVGRSLFGEEVDDLVPALHDLVPAVAEVTVRRRTVPWAVPLRYHTPGNRLPRRLRAQEYSIIDEVLSRAPATDGRDDLVARLRAATDPDTGGSLSEQEIRDQALIFLLAGHETTAGALTFTLHLLGTHPDIQHRVACEVRDVLGHKPAPDADDIPALVWTRASLQEGMRLFPSAHVTERANLEPMTLQGYEIPARTFMIVSPWTTQRHPSFWPEPDRYDPTRFIGDHERHRYAYFPFGGGPRSCVGEHFAMLEGVIALATLLRDREVRAIKPTMPVTARITVRPAGPVPAILTRRAHRLRSVA
jgi:cytochrome P450